MSNSTNSKTTNIFSGDLKPDPKDQPQCICGEINARHCQVHQETEKQPAQSFSLEDVVVIKKNNNCPDCLKRVESYTKSVLEWKEAYEALQKELSESKAKEKEMAMRVVEKNNENSDLIVELERVKAEAKDFEESAVDSYRKDKAEIERLRTVLAQRKTEMREENQKLRELLENLDYSSICNKCEKNQKEVETALGSEEGE